jgi:hypothetical protein
MSSDGTVFGGTCRVPLNHRARSPACDAHQVCLGTSADKPDVAECVSKQMRMDTKASLQGPSFNRLADA